MREFSEGLPGGRARRRFPRLGSCAIQGMKPASASPPLRYLDASELASLLGLSLRTTYCEQDTAPGCYHHAPSSTTASFCAGERMLSKPGCRNRTAELSPERCLALEGHLHTSRCELRERSLKSNRTHFRPARPASFSQRRLGNPRLPTGSMHLSAGPVLSRSPDSTVEALLHGEKGPRAEHPKLKK
jgi:hypothetical protein